MAYWLPVPPLHLSLVARMPLIPRWYKLRKCNLILDSAKRFLKKDWGKGANCLLKVKQTLHSSRIAEPGPQFLGPGCTLMHAKLITDLFSRPKHQLNFPVNFGTEIETKVILSYCVSTTKLSRYFCSYFLFS